MNDSLTTIDELLIEFDHVKCRTLTFSMHATEGIVREIHQECL